MTCHRTWEAAAIEDGRLDAQGAASFERHVALCSECAHEVKALRELGEVLRRIEPPPLSAFESRRMRAELQRKAHQRSIEPPRSRLPGTAWVLAAACLCAIAFGVWLRWHSSHPTELEARRPEAQSLDAHSPEAALAPRFELRPLAHATLQDKTKAAFGHVVLDSGAVGVHVEHLRDGQRFIMTLPDGELEVLGTRFFVEVAEHTTQRVVVTEGVVALRLRGKPARAITAGESWVRASTESTNPVAMAAPLEAATPIKGAPRAPTHAAPRSAPVEPASREASEIPPSAPKTTTGKAPPTPITRAATIVPSEVSNEANPGREFSAGIGAFERGAYAEADNRLASFVARFPRESRVEDALYLRAIIATRRGNVPTAQARAREYLERFPNGLRRAEMERVANGP